MTEAEFIKSKGTWELNPSTGLEISRGFGKGVWFVLDNTNNGETVFKGCFEDAFNLYDHA